MNVDRIITIVGILAAVAAVFLPLEWWALILLVVGLVGGFVTPAPDMMTRMAYIIAAVGLPTVANSLDAIPQVGGQLNAFIDNFAVVVGGMAIASFIMMLKDRVMDSGDAE